MAEQVNLAPTVGRTPDADRAADNRWWILAVAGLAQLMVVLDATIVNIALPSAQRDLGFSNADRQWVVTAYSLAFGGLLLLGGRLSDLVGRRRMFLIGLVGFAGASALGGAATGFVTLVIARAIQGAFGAMLAPAALSILTTTFVEPSERGKAFGVYGAIAGSGGAVGLLLGGVLTEYLSWRWCLYVNVALAVVALVGAMRLLVNQPRNPDVRLDPPGSVLAVTGLVAFVYGMSEAATHGWGAPLTVTLIVGGVVLLAGFVLVERRAEHPLLPLRVVLNRYRGGLLPGHRAHGYSPVRRFFVPHLLPAADPRLLARKDRSGFPPAHRHGHGRLHRVYRRAAAPGRPSPVGPARDAYRCRRSRVVTPAGVGHGLRERHPARAPPGWVRAGPRVRLCDQHRHLRRPARGRGGGLGHGEHQPTGGRLHRHGSAQQHRRQRCQCLFARPRPRPREPGAGCGAQLRGVFHGGVRHICLRGRGLGGGVALGHPEAGRSRTEAGKRSRTGPGMTRSGRGT